MAAVASYFRLAFAPRRAAMTFASIWIEFPRRRANAKRGSALLLILRIHVRQDVLLHLHDRLIDLAIGAHVRARDHLVQLVRLCAASDRLARRRRGRRRTGRGNGSWRR